MSPGADATWEQLARFVVGVSDKVQSPEEVRPESRLIEDLGLSSLMVVNLVIDLENEFGIIVNEQDFDHLETVADLKRLVERKRAGALA